MTAILGVGACLVWTWSQRAARDLAPPTDVELDTEDILRRQVEIRQLEKDRLATGAQILFGLAVLAGLVLTWLRIRVTDKQANAALRNAEIAQDQLQLARRQQTADRFTQAIEQLGHDKLDIRLGGIYALEKIARDEPEEYFNLFREVLCAFVRETARTPHEDVSLFDVSLLTEDEQEKIPLLPTDLQAALTVLGRYPPPDVVKNPALIDWSRTYLMGADLSGAHLDHGVFVAAHLEMAKLFNAHLNDASFYNAHLKGTAFGGAHLENANFTEAWLERAHLSYAYLKNAWIGYAYLASADLSNAHAERASFLGSPPWCVAEDPGR